MSHVLVVGAGSIGERHLRCFLATGRTRVSFVEVNPALRSTIAERYSVPGFPDLEAGLSALPTAAVIATPAPLHIPQALACVRQGAHVLIEKPLSTTFDDIETLRNEVAARKLVAAVAYVYRCFPLFQAVHDAVRSGRFGQPLEIVAVSGQHFPTYRPAYRSIYYRDRAMGGGAIQDALTHVLNAGEWLLGPITRLVADAEHLALPDVTVEDTVHLLARHGSVLASYSLNQHQAPNEMQITVICTKGSVRAELPANRWSWMTEPGSSWTAHDIGPSERDTPFIAQANRFLDAVEGRVPPPCSLEEGWQTLRVNQAALASVAEGCWKTV